MTKQTRVGDIGVGTCPFHGKVTTTFVTGSSDVLTNGKKSCWIGTVGTCSCGHTSLATTGSSKNFMDGKAAHRIGDTGVIANGGIYTVATGSPDTDKGDNVGSAVPVVTIPGFAPWAPITDVAASITEDQHTPVTSAQQEIFKKANINPNQVNPNPPAPDATPVPPAGAKPPTDCTDIHGKTSFPTNFQLSTNYVLGHVTTSCALTHQAAQAQVGLAIDDVVCNLRGLCVNLLEPLAAKYGRPTITSAFRGPGDNPGSLHMRGMAADLQWPISDQEYYDRACWVRDTLPWCEVILEFGGNRPWIHVAYDAKSAKRYAATRITVAKGYTQGIVKCTNVPNVGGTRLA